MHTITRIARGAGLCLTLGLFTAAGAAAGAAGPAVADAASQPADEGLEVIVVTANKRAEDLQKIPIAVTAITAD
jgi:iron complex outermembrane recepter protein